MTKEPEIKIPKYIECARMLLTSFETINTTDTRPSLALRTAESWLSEANKEKMTTSAHYGTQAIIRSRAAADAALGLLERDFPSGEELKFAFGKFELTSNECDTALQAINEVRESVDSKGEVEQSLLKAERAVKRAKGASQANQHFAEVILSVAASLACAHAADETSNYAYSNVEASRFKKVADRLSPDSDEAEH